MLLAGHGCGDQTVDVNVAGQVLETVLAWLQAVDDRRHSLQAASAQVTKVRRLHRMHELFHKKDVKEWRNGQGGRGL